MKHIILCNLGGPNKRNEVRSFLFNLFNDKYIIPLPFPLRTFIAFMISTLRFKKSTGEYDKMGGKSPILENTQKQAEKLQEMLGNEFKVHISMRYNHPFTKEVLQDIAKDYNGENVLFLPLYPQFSLTTTQSSIVQFEKLAEKLKIYNIDSIRSFYKNVKYIQSCASSIKNSILLFKNKSVKTIILFSAHGIPEDFVSKKKDLYKKHIEETAGMIWSELNLGEEFACEICFQSRVGPKEWLKPYIQNVIPKHKGKNMVVFPIAFVSEHLETLVELDMEYSHLAKECNVEEYIRAKTPSDNNLFIECLCDEILKRMI
jgi:ferrochelatase